MEITSFQRLLNLFPESWIPIRCELRMSHDRFARRQNLHLYRLRPMIDDRHLVSRLPDFHCPRGVGQAFFFLAHHVPPFSEEFVSQLAFLNR